MDSFVLLAYASLAASRTLLQRLLAWLNLYFRIRRFILLAKTKKLISLNYGSSTSSWKPGRWVRFDLIFSMKDIYMNSNLSPRTKFTSSSRSTEFNNYPPMEHLSNDHRDHPNQHENSHKLCDETGHLDVNLMESQWKLRRHDQNFPVEGRPL